MVAKGKVVTAKWGVPSKEPEDLPDFLSNEEIVEKMGGEPRGVFRFWIKQITVVKNKNDEDMLKIVAEINETAKDKKGYNGYTCWENQNVTEQGAPFLKQFLKSLGVSWQDFQRRTKMTQETTVDPAKITAIGSVNLAGKTKVLVKATTKMDTYQGNTRAVISRWLPKDHDADDSEDIDDDELLEDDEELEEEDLEEVDEDDEELEEEEDENSEEDEDADDEEAELREELDGLGVVALKKRAKGNDPDLAKLPVKKADLIELIVEQELLADEEEEEDEELEDDSEEADAELREELNGLTIAALKKRAKTNGAKVAVLNKIKDKAKVIDIIVEQELGDGDEDDEDPPF